jgi:hypothetical protein
MGNCLGSDDHNGAQALGQGLMPAGVMVREPSFDSVDPNDPWRDWYYNDYDTAEGAGGGRLPSGRWDMSRASFRAELADKNKVREELEKSTSAAAAAAAAAAQQQTPPRLQKQQRPMAMGGVDAAHAGSAAAKNSRGGGAGAGGGRGRAGGARRFTVTVEPSELLTKEVQCEVAAASVAEFGSQLSAKLRVASAAAVMCWDADFGDWAQLEGLSEISMPGARVKLVPVKPLTSSR